MLLHADLNTSRLSRRNLVIKCCSYAPDSTCMMHYETWSLDFPYDHNGLANFLLTFFSPTQADSRWQYFYANFNMNLSCKRKCIKHVLLYIERSRWMLSVKPSTLEVLTTGNCHVTCMMVALIYFIRGLKRSLNCIFVELTFSETLAIHVVNASSRRLGHIPLKSRQ